ncbi:MAG: hypothetical protein WDW38_007139 [Sanguina aurantia]
MSVMAPALRTVTTLDLSSDPAVKQPYRFEFLHARWGEEERSSSDFRGNPTPVTNILSNIHHAWLLEGMLQQGVLPNLTRLKMTHSMRPSHRDRSLWELLLSRPLTHLEVGNGWLCCNEVRAWHALPSTLKVVRCTGLPNSTGDVQHLTQLEEVHLSDMYARMDVQALADLLRALPSLKLIASLDHGGNDMTFPEDTYPPPVVDSLNFLHQRMAAGFVLPGFLVATSGPRSVVQERDATPVPLLRMLQALPVFPTFTSVSLISEDHGGGAGGLLALSRAFSRLESLCVRTMGRDGGIPELGAHQGALLEEVRHLRVLDGLAATAALQLVACMPRLETLELSGSLEPSDPFTSVYQAMLGDDSAGSGEWELDEENDCSETTRWIRRPVV